MGQRLYWRTTRRVSRSARAVATRQMRYNYVLAKGEIKPTYISTEHQLADLTKPLDKIRLARLRARVVMS